VRCVVHTVDVLWIPCYAVTTYNKLSALSLNAMLFHSKEHLDEYQ